MNLNQFIAASITHSHSWWQSKFGEDQVKSQEKDRAAFERATRNQIPTGYKPMTEAEVIDWLVNWREIASRRQSVEVVNRCLESLMDTKRLDWLMKEVYKTSRESIDHAMESQ